MKKLICGLTLALGISFSCHAQGMKISAYPNTNNLAGTNLFLIAIPGSPGTNMNISYAQLSNLLAAAIGGGGGGVQVWTNDGAWVFPTPGNVTNFFDFTSTVANSSTNSIFNVGSSRILNLATQSIFSVINAGSNVLRVDVDGGIKIGRNEYIHSGGDDKQHIFSAIRDSSIGEEGDNYFTVASTTGNVANNYSSFQAEVSGDYQFSSLNISSYDFVTANDFKTISLFVAPTDTELSLKYGSSRRMTKLRPTVADDGSTPYVFDTLTNRTSGDIFQVNNNTTNRFSVAFNGVSRPFLGTLYASNALALPTVSQLGVGGYWVGNSNGYLVTLYTLDGSTTVMKVLAP